MQLTDNQRRVRIRDLNDTFRKTHDPTLGHVMLTAGVNALPSDVSAMAIRKVATFDADNDPHGEHDFGSFDLAGDKFFWKIDYYDRNFEFGVTVRSEPPNRKSAFQPQNQGDYGDYAICACCRDVTHSSEGGKTQAALLTMHNRC